MVCLSQPQMRPQVRPQAHATQPPRGGPRQLRRGGAVAAAAVLPHAGRSAP